MQVFSLRELYCSILQTVEIKSEMSRPPAERDAWGLEPGPGVQQVSAGGRTDPRVGPRLQTQTRKCQGMYFCEAETMMPYDWWIGCKVA